MDIKKRIWYSITIPSLSEKMVEVEESILSALEPAGFDDTETFAVRVALDEALANAIKHGNAHDPSKKILIRYRVEDSGITISVRDEGSGFDYDDLPDPTSADRLELPSGRGLLLMQSYMDEVRFNEEGNEVTMVKCRRVKECAR